MAILEDWDLRMWGALDRCFSFFFRSFAGMFWRSKLKRVKQRKRILDHGDLRYVENGM